MSERDINSEAAYDQVMLTADDGNVRRMTRSQFESMPLDERVRSLLQKRLKFYRRGAEVPVRQALRNQ